MASKLIITGGGAQPDGVLLGDATTEKVGFHGATPVVQRAGAAQAAVATTVGAAIVDITGGQSPTEAEHIEATTRINELRADVLALTVLANELRAALVEKGAIKGAA